MTTSTSQFRFGIGNDLAWSKQAQKDAPESFATSRTGVSAALARLAQRFLCDRHGQISRPMFLLGIIATDLVIIAMTGLAAVFGTAGTPAEINIGTIAALIVPWFVMAVLSSHWSYSIAALRQPASQIVKILTAIAVVSLSACGVLFLVSNDAMQPATALSWVAGAAVTLALARIATSRTINHLAVAGRLRRRAVIVGGGDDASQLIDLLSDESTHLELLGLFDDRTAHREGDNSVPGLRRLGSFDELAAFCREAGVELLIVSVPAAAEDRLLQIVKRLFALPVDIRISAHNSKLPLNRSAYSYIGKVPMLPILDRPLNDRDRLIKNLEDRFLGFLILLLALPVMAIVALAVRLESKGPILFRQKRLGFNNELIDVCKFRSMYTDMSDAAAAKLVTKDDPRVTRVGRFIRRTSLDELPQLFNVLRGEMSIVGPRPHALQAKAGDDLYHDAVRSYFARHKVKPGITGWAQVNGWRGETDTLEKIEQRVEHDMYYINNWSVLMDLYIIVITPFSLIAGKNAY